MTLPGQTSRSASRTATARRPHFVYRCYDADDRLLYVGCTYDVKRRMSSHRNAAKTVASKVIRDYAVRIETSLPYDCRADALAAEAVAIGDELPVLNYHHSAGADVPAWLTWTRVAHYIEERGGELAACGMERCSCCGSADKIDCFDDDRLCAFCAEVDDCHVEVPA